MKTILATNSLTQNAKHWNVHQPIYSLLIVLLGAASLAAAESANPKRESGNISSNPIIFIPGTMGSRLVEEKTKRVVWGEFAGRAANKKSGVLSHGMALPMVPGRRIDQIRDSVSEDGVLHDLHLTILAGVNLNPSFYEGILNRISGKADPGEKKKQRREEAKEKRICCEFGYDWRRSCDENAARLATFIDQKKRDIEAMRRAVGNSDPVRFDIVAHSQGVLVARYYLRHGDQLIGQGGCLPSINWAGGRHVENVIFLGAPNGGIALTLKYLTHGRRAHLLLPFYEPSVLGTMPSLYQLMPRASDRVLIEQGTGENLDPLDFNLWVEKKWGLANPRQDKELARILPHVKSAKDRRLIALDHLGKCLSLAKQFQAAMDRPASRPRHLRVVLCACDSKKTPARFAAFRHKVRVDLKMPGDGTVALYSAARCPSPIERGEASKSCWDLFRVFNANHTDLATDPEVSGFFLNAISSPNSRLREEPNLAVAGKNSKRMSIIFHGSRR